MINYILEVSCCWLGFYLVYTLWLSKETFFTTNRWYLLVTLLLGLWLPFAELPMSAANQQDIFYYFETVTIGVQEVEKHIATVVAQPLSTGLSIEMILTGVYVAGLLFMLGRFGLGVVQIFRHYRYSEKQKKEGYTLLISTEVHLPFSFFHFLFLSASAKYSHEDLDNITQHELVHIKGRHSVDVLFVELLNVLFWCSPIIYLYRRSLRNVHEYLADASVLQTTSKKQYGQLLLQQFQKGPGMAMANNFIHSQLKKRIEMMTKNQSINTARWKYLLTVPVFLCLFFALAKTDLIAQINQSDNKEQNSKLERERIHPILKNKTNEQGDPIYTVVEEMPRFKGCEEVEDKEKRKKCSQQKMLEFIYKNIRYPEAARKGDIEGTVVIKFVIDKAGKVTSSEVVRSIGGGCAEEALRVVNEMPDWIPGRQRGKNVSVYFNLPIRYKLDEESKIIETDRVSIPKDKKEEIYSFGPREEMPRFPGCENITDNKGDRQKCAKEKLLKFVYTHIKYPKEAQSAGIEGMAIVKFVINKNGQVVKPEIVRSLGHGTDETILEMMEEMMALEEKWIPGTQAGKAVDVTYHLPVRFKLTPEDKADTKSAETIRKPGVQSLEVRSFSISPNPVKDQLQISFEVEDYKGLTLHVTDSNGRFLGSSKSSITQAKNEMTIDLSDAAPGMLFVTLRNGKKMITKKVLKQ